MKIYLIGSLRNAHVPVLAAKVRQLGHEVFDDWYAAGPEADDYWQKYEQAKGHDYAEALAGYPAEHVYMYDKSHLDRCDAAILLLPAGKSGHLEFGYMIGSGKPGWILLPEQIERWDVMYKFATQVFHKEAGLLDHLQSLANQTSRQQSLIDAQMVKEGSFSLSPSMAEHGFSLGPIQTSWKNPVGTTTPL